MRRITPMMSFGLAALLILSSFACNNKENEAADNTSDKNAKGVAGTTKLAYVEVDSLLSQYEYCKEYTLILTKKSENIQSTIASKGQALENAVANFQKRLQTGGITSEEQANKERASLQKQQTDLQSLQGRLAEEFAKEQEKYNAALRDSLRNFLNEYNKTHKYTMILSKSGDNILLAEKSMDITSDVINGLNKRYKKEKK